MAKVTSQFACPGCGTMGDVAFKKPSYFSQTRHKWTCSNCGSRWFLFISKPKNAEPGQVKIESAILEISQKLYEKLMAEQKAKEENAKPETTSEPARPQS